MRPRAFHRTTTARLAGVAILLALLLVGLPAYGQAIKVTSAVPDAADQGTVGLVVTVGGENFASGAKVAFYVTGTTNPGGIAVKGVKVKDSKTLEATIDVAPDAQTDLKFDVQVKCGGRTGKGTELFKVNVKVTGGDTTPPGSVLDLNSIPYGFNGTLFSWTVPADDGYDLSSGPAASFKFAIRAGYSPQTPLCGPFTEEVWGSSYDLFLDPCLAAGNFTATWATESLGAGETRTARKALAPETEYWAIVRYCDDAMHAANCSPLADDLLHQLRYVTGPPTHRTWSVSVPDACPPQTWYTCQLTPSPQLDFDLAGNPAMLYDKAGVRTLASWDGAAWQIEPVGPGISSGSYSFAFDPSGFATVARAGTTGSTSDLRYFRRTEATSAAWESELVTTGEATANALAFNPLDGSPVIAFTCRPKPNVFTLRLAERHGTTWEIRNVSNVSGGWNQGPRRIAFDAAGNPALVFVRDVKGVPELAFALWANGAWTVETVAGPATPGGPFTHLAYVSVVFDPVRGDFSAACRLSGSSGAQATYCERSGGAWACEGIERDSYLSGVALEVRSDGTAYVAYTVAGVRIAAIRAPGGAWEREYVDWNGGDDSNIYVKVGPDGRPAITYAGAHDATGAGYNTAACIARRAAPAP